MKTYKVKIEIIGLGGKEQYDCEVKAKNRASALNKAYKKIGNQTGQVLDVQEV